MPQVVAAPPYSEAEVVTDILHGVSVTDPYRWLEDPHSTRTRNWIAAQTDYARAYLDSIPGRDRIRDDIHRFLAVETCDSFQWAAGRYFFRKRLPEQEQFCIYVREGLNGKDQLLIDPAERGTGKHTAVKPIRISSDGRLLLYEIKEGGERTGKFELFDVDKRRNLADSLPRGYLRGFEFTSDGKAFFFCHEAQETTGPFDRTVYKHTLGTPFTSDKEVFNAGNDRRIRIALVSGSGSLAIIVNRFLEKTLTDIHLTDLDQEAPVRRIFGDLDFAFVIRLMKGAILAVTDLNAPNRRVVKIVLKENCAPEWVELVPETDARIRRWAVAGERIVLNYVKGLTQRICTFDLAGKRLGEIQVDRSETTRIVAASQDSSEIVLESESFVQPVATYIGNLQTGRRTLWAQTAAPIDPSQYSYFRVWYESKDGTQIPMSLVGKHDVLKRHNNPVIMTSYGGYGVSMTPRFSVFVAFLMARGCLFALPNIRGGSEFGAAWHSAAKRHRRQTAYDDFLAAADWLVNSGRANPDKLAIFGGSNSGLLVGAALTQRPELFRAVLCMVPLLDMVRYHLFDNAHVWRDELGTADEASDFYSLFAYSPYHRVREGTRYPAVMLVSGDSDQNCNPLHARKMCARLQAASISPWPVILDYSRFRGHSPVLPLSERIEALTDRMAFLCDQLGLPMEGA